MLEPNFEKADGLGIRKPALKEAPKRFQEAPRKL